MLKKVIIIIGVVVFLGIIVVLFIFFRGASKSNSEVVSIDRLVVDYQKAHPELTSAQINFYKDTAILGNMTPCLGKIDQNICITAVATLKQSSAYCGEIVAVQAKAACFDSVLLQNANSEIAQCNTIVEIDLKAQCFMDLFKIYQQPQECAIFKDSIVNNDCQSSVYIRQAQLENNVKICDNISNSFVKMYCLQSLSVR